MARLLLLVVVSALAVSARGFPRGYDGRSPIGNDDHHHLGSFSSHYVALHGAGEEYRPDGRGGEE